MPTPLRLMVYRHSVFYSPLLAGIGAGLFAAEGFAPTYTVMPAGRTVADMLAGGEIDVSQTAVSASFAWLERNELPPVACFAQLNARDGFLLAGRQPDPDFRWDKLADGRFMFVHGGQPQAMLAYALHRRGVDLARLDGLDAGGTEAMMAAFRAGQGDYFHEQAPYPQQLELEGHAHVLASVGEIIGPVAFSCLGATPSWLSGPHAAPFVRVYRRAREWVQSAPVADVAAAVRGFFPTIADAAIVRALDYYRGLGCWTGDVEIPRADYEVALDVYAHSGLVTRRHDYDRVVVKPPAG
jgi:NitT/TauT family transport system substrate-binding protein